MPATKPLLDRSLGGDAGDVTLFIQLAPPQAAERGEQVVAFIDAVARGSDSADDAAELLLEVLPSSRDHEARWWLTSYVGWRLEVLLAAGRLDQAIPTTDELLRQPPSVLARLAITVARQHAAAERVVACDNTPRLADRIH